MATILRQWSYQYPPLYNAISRVSALAVGGEQQFRTLALKGLNINSQTKILDLCCGAGQTTAILTKYSENVTGLDASGVALKEAAQKVPQATYIQGLAQQMPLPDNHFDLVHTSVALHEMTQSELDQILREVYRVVKPGGIFALIDFHPPRNFLFWPPLALFFWLFETQTAWELLRIDLLAKLQAVGFEIMQQQLYVGGSLQVVQAKKPD